MEEAVAAGKTLNQEQKEVMRSKPTLAAVIDELERLRAPLAVAVAEEASVAPAPAPAASGSDSSVQDLLALVYFGALFDVKPQSDFIATMAAREHERSSCITYDCVGDDTVDLLVEGDLDVVYAVAALAAARPASAVGVSHRDALQACAHHARLWLARADEPIHPGSSVTYAAVRAKLDRIMASDYYTAAAVGGYGAEGVQAQESMAASPEVSAVEENLTAEGHKVTELKESSITTPQEPDVLLGTSSTSPQAAAHDTMEVSPPSGRSSLGLPILIRNLPDWYYIFYIRTDLSGSFHTYPALDGPFPTLEEADNAIDRYLRHRLHPKMCEESLKELPEIDRLVRTTMYWPDGARKTGWKWPATDKNIPNNLMIQASLDQYNEDRNLVGGLAYELKDVLRNHVFFSEGDTYHHFNFTAKTKGADDFDSGILFFAEFKIMPQRQQIVAGCCCMIKPDDKGHCYGCANGRKADMQHPNEAGAYSCGHVKAWSPFGGAATPRMVWPPFEESEKDEERRLKYQYGDMADSPILAILREVGRITANEEAHS